MRIFSGTPAKKHIFSPWTPSAPRSATVRPPTNGSVWKKRHFHNGIKKRISLVSCSFQAASEMIQGFFFSQYQVILKTELKKMIKKVFQRKVVTTKICMVVQRLLFSPHLPYSESGWKHFWIDFACSSFARVSFLTHYYDSFPQSRGIHFRWTGVCLFVPNQTAQQLKNPPQ